MPEDKTVVLGLVSTKSASLEHRDVLVSRVGEASRFVPLERLAVSPQCGFASSILGNRISPESQQRKLEVVVAAARAIWGHA